LAGVANAAPIRFGRLNGGHSPLKSISPNFSSTDKQRGEIVKALT